MSNASKPSKIPEFANYEEEARFWDEHDTTEFEDDWEEVELKVIQPLTHVFDVPLDAATIAKLGEMGRARGIAAGALARNWLLERLALEENQSRKRRKEA